MERYLMISDAAKEVQVESHVLRYWEEELHLPIRRNELGHRYYTEGDVELFKQIKSMKEGGLQLKAIKMILKDGKLDVMVPENEAADEKQEGEQRSQESMAIQIIGSGDTNLEETGAKQQIESREEKARRLQWLLQQLIRETLQENNKELCREIKESVVKELDYQFRAQEEKEEERDKLREQREEEHYQKLDALLRKKVKMGKNVSEPQSKDVQSKDSQSKDSQSKDTKVSSPQNQEQEQGKKADEENRKKKGSVGRKRFGFF